MGGIVRMSTKEGLAALLKQTNEAATEASLFPPELYELDAQKAAQEASMVKYDGEIVPLTSDGYQPTAQIITAELSGSVSEADLKSALSQYGVVTAAIPVESTRSFMVTFEKVSQAMAAAEACKNGDMDHLFGKPSVNDASSNGAPQ